MQPHIKVKNVPAKVLLMGDPKRVGLVGSFLEKFNIIAKNREFRLGVGIYKGKEILACSAGIGCPSTAIAVEELINAGAKTIIRIGTCGGAWRSDISAGSLIIPTSSIRDEGASLEYIPQGFPAVADIDVTNALMASADKLKFKKFVGINRTHDAFYGSQKTITKWGLYLAEKRWQKSDTPILSSEMECSILFVIASLRNVKAGAILAVNSNPEPLKERVANKKLLVITESNEKVTRKTVEKMIEVALEAMTVL